MRAPDSGYISTILATAEAPCVSIYLPVSRGSGAKRPAPTQFRDLVHRAEVVLKKSHPDAAAGIAERLHALHGDEDFWGHTLDGVAVLASPDRFDVFTLPRSVPEHVEVEASFHVKPLLRYVQSAEPFHVLGVSRERVALFRGNRYVMAPLPAPGVQLTIDAAPPPDVKAAPVEVGHGQIAAPDAERFFREVDKQVTHRVSEPSGLPLILAGTEENLAAFRAVTKNRFAVADGVHGDWTHWTLNEIREAAWKVFEKHYLDRLARIREDFGTASARGKGTADLAEAATAAAIGRVGVLLIDADRELPGALDMATGAATPAAGATAAGDMLDDLAEMALKTKATVIVTPTAQMPTQTGLAAIYRY